MSDHESAFDLAACEEALKRLEAEICVLREASNTFADLAERLNRQLTVLRSNLASKPSIQPPTGIDAGQWPSE